jgi:hypothetical protein
MRPDTHGVQSVHLPPVLRSDTINSVKQ